MTLAVHGLEVRYGDQIALHATSLTLATGGVVALVGPNGAGKSSLLKALAGLARAHAGNVGWNGLPLDGIDRHVRARTIAYLPQAPTVHWPLRVRDLVALGRLPHRAYGSAETAVDRQAVEWALSRTGTAALAERSVEELSVGERARVLLARAIAVGAPVLLVDEPTAMLDPRHQLQIMTMLRDYAQGSIEGAPGTHESPRLVVAVLHDLTLAARFCSRALLLSRGAIVADGAPTEALSTAQIRQHYRVEPFVSTHDGAAVIVPWQALETKRGGTAGA